MRNFNILIGGQIGSGKTTLARALVELSARAIVLDAKTEYEIDGALYGYSYDECVKLLVGARHGRFCLVSRASTDHNLGLLELVAHIQTTEPHGPLVIVAEEASLYSTRYRLSGIMHTLYTQGRHMRISLITVIQYDTDINLMTKHSAAVMACFYQPILSGALQQSFSIDAVTALTPLSKSYTYPPVQNEHFITMPDVDLYYEWHKRHGYLLDSAGSVSV